MTGLNKSNLSIIEQNFYIKLFIMRGNTHNLSAILQKFADCSDGQVRYNTSQWRFQQLGTELFFKVFFCKKQIINLFHVLSQRLCMVLNFRAYKALQPLFDQRNFRTQMSFFGNRDLPLKF